MQQQQFETLTVTSANDSRIETAELPALADWLELSPRGTAVCLSSDSNYADILPYLSALDLIAIDFGDSTDGRGFSLARALRQAGYNAELRATGRIIRDQLQFLQRCGFNSFDLPDNTGIEAAIKSLYEITVSYQPSDQEQRPIALHTR